MSLEFRDMPLRRCASKVVARRQLILGSDQRRCSQFALVANGRTPANCVVRSRDRECPLNVRLQPSGECAKGTTCHVPSGTPAVMAAGAGVGATSTSPDSR
jgi:hypothetical protein